MIKFLLYSEDAFREFVKSLPALLLENRINDSTIQMLNRVVLQYRPWIQKELEQNHDSIIGKNYRIQLLNCAFKSFYFQLYFY